MKAQFGIADLLWAIFWMGVFLVSLRLDWYFAYDTFPRLRYISCLVVLAAALYGVWTKRPLIWGVVSFLIWLLVAMPLLNLAFEFRE
jgi:hypothetical protein